MDFNFSNEATFTFSAYLTWRQMTFDLDMRPLTSPTNHPMLHLWPNFGWNPSKWKVEQNVNLFSQQQQTTTKDNNRQKHWTERSLCVFTATAGDTKTKTTKTTLVYLLFCFIFMTFSCVFLHPPLTLVFCPENFNIKIFAWLIIHQNIIIFLTMGGGGRDA